MWLRQETSTLSHNRVIKAKGTGCRACPFWCPDRTQRRKEAPSDITRCRYYWSFFVFPVLLAVLFFQHLHDLGVCIPPASICFPIYRGWGMTRLRCTITTVFLPRDLSAAACADAEKWIKHNSDLQEDPRCAGSFLFSRVDGTILVRISSWSENSRPGRKKSISQNFH